ncbi:MAG: 30S ribosomal protein S7 [Candidatus Andersenbacteria bacterium]|nr:30S ribosomal protein S7 [Candidatus Andersenbacteria bacterium]
MGRRKKKIDRGIKPDFRYNNALLARFINYIMEDGKRTVAIKVVYSALDIVKEKTKKDPIEAFEEAFNKVAPILEVKSKRIGGATYQVPIEVRGDRRMQLAFRWLIGAAKEKKGKPMSVKLAEEIVDIINGTGSSMKKREDVQKMAEANRAFAHFAR